MNDIDCLFSGIVWLLTPSLLLFFWHKKTGARLFPALAAFLICFPVFMIGDAVRSGFSHDGFISYYLQQGLLFGILEEGTKYLMMKYALTKYDTRKDAVTYGIGHCSYEDLGSALTCFGLVGKGTAAPDIFIVNLFGSIEGIAFCTAASVLIFYAIRRDKVKTILPIVMLLHTVSNAVQGIFGISFAIIASLLITTGMCYAAYRCWNDMWSPYENEQE